MKIRITQRHIDLGCPKSTDPEQDPVALAIYEATGLWVEVRSRKVITHYGQHYLPNPVQKFIEAFDDGQRVGPIEFELGVR